jgi:hypothetical protein
MRIPTSTISPMIARTLEGCVICLMALWGTFNSASATANSLDEAEIREYANGAGPTAIFRFGRDNVNQWDVFGVVDPVLWRIQFYTLRDPNPSEELPLGQRLKKVGDCRLPPTFRVWRIHERPDEVILQSQPEITDPSSQPFKYRKITLIAGAENIRSIVDRPPTDVEQLPSTPCGSGESLDNLPEFQAEFDSASEISGGGKRVFTVKPLLTNLTTDQLAQLEPFLRSPLTLPADDPEDNPDASPFSWQSSAQELESARSQTILFRYFIVTSRSAAHPGFSTSVVRLIRVGNDRSVVRMRLNIGLTRVKSGQRYVAISSTGEVIIIGASDQKHFAFRLCDFADTNQKHESCTVESEPVDLSFEGAGVVASAAEPLLSDGSAGDGEAPNAIWRKATRYALWRFKIDADKMDPECRYWEKPRECVVGQNQLKWQPISELRFSTGIYEKRGFPYGSTPASRAEGRPSPDGELTFPAKEPIPAESSVETHQLVISDIENSDLANNNTPSSPGDSTGVSVLGIDCSAFVSDLWGRAPTDTSGFINAANNPRSKKTLRKTDVAHLQMGDALVIYLPGTINHMVLFRQANHVSSQDSSQAFLVIESSSSCGGVCWSYYDESFFHGWALIQNGPMTPQSSRRKLDSIPTDFSVWRRYFVSKESAD